MPQKKYLLALLMVFNISPAIYSQVVSQQGPQQIYRLIKGDIAITLTYKDTAIVASSNQLVLILDYETSKLLFRVKYETFHTGIDSIDSKFNLLKGLELKFEGKLDIFVNSKKFSPQKYNLQGTVNSSTPPFNAEGNGTVICIAPGSDAVPSCKLIAAIKTTLSTLNLADIFKNADNNIQIDILQSLLQKEKAN